MKKYEFRGYSGDLVYIEHQDSWMDHCPETEGPIVLMNACSSEGMRIIPVFQYGLWSFACGQVGEGVPVPAWPVQVRNYIDPLPDAPKQYSVILSVEVPDDVYVYGPAGIVI